MWERSPYSSKMVISANSAVWRWGAGAAWGGDRRDEIVELLLLDPPHGDERHDQAHVADAGIGERLGCADQQVDTGLGQAAAVVRSKPEVFTQPVLVQAQATGTHDAVAFGSTPDYSHLDVPAVVRKRNVTVEALANSGVDRYDIPAFLRKQAD